jgi:hypothetical protein
MLDFADWPTYSTTAGQMTSCRAESPLTGLSFRFWVALATAQKKERKGLNRSSFFDGLSVLMTDAKDLRAG